MSDHHTPRVEMLDESSPSALTAIYTAHPLSELEAITASGATNYKVVHFIRHAQGQHNLAVAEKNGDEEEYKNWAWRDSRLTELGKSQASALRPTMEKYHLSVVLVSPLSRTIQTGKLAIPEGPPFIVEDDVRERIGTHPCDLRRSRSELKLDFPDIDVSALGSEDDDKWTTEREPWTALVERTHRVLEKLRRRPETHIGVVTHNDFLQALLYDSQLKLASPELRKKFGNAEHMAIVLTWVESPNSPITSCCSSTIASGSTASVTAE